MKFDILGIVNETLATGKKFFLKNKPRIFMFGGIALSTTGTVVACAATYKHIDRVLDTAKDEIETAEDNKEKTKAIVKAAGNIAKTYAIPAAMIAVGNASIIYANHVQEQRQQILSESLTTLGAAYAAYRKRMEERLGKEEEEKARFDISEAEITTDKGDGKKPKKEKLELVDKDTALDASPFARFYDETCETWCGEPEYDLTFLKQAEFECNNQLKREGYLFLSDVYRKLGIQITKQSLVAGWLYNQEELSDSYVDFGIFNSKSRPNRRFVNCLENVILLDFNCSSNIADYI